MRHQAFGMLAAVLSESDLARILVLYGLQPTDLRGFLSSRTGVQGWTSNLQVRLDRSDVDPYSRAIHLRLDLSRAFRFIAQANASSERIARLGRAAHELWSSSFEPGQVRFRVTLVNPPAELDLQWLAEILVGSGLGIESVTRELTARHADYWDWPLRIRVPETPAGLELVRLLQQAQYNDLYDASVVQPADRACDVLVFPGTLAELDRVPLPLGLTAAALLVLGDGSAEGPPDRQTLGRGMQRFLSAGLAALCFVPPAEHVAWLMTVVRELSHNALLPTALFRARLAGERLTEGGPLAQNLPAPFIAANDGFVQAARIAAVARRLGEAMQRPPFADTVISVGASAADPAIHAALYLASAPVAAPVPIRMLGRGLIRETPNLTWSSERGDAKALVHLRRLVERETGPFDLRMASRELAHRGGSGRGESASRKQAGPRAEHRTGPEEERCVQCRVTPASTPSETVKRLQPKAPHLAAIHISANFAPDAIVAGTPIDLAALPPDASGHVLDIVFCPLSADDDGRIAAPQSCQLYLPKVGDSLGRASFLFVTAADPEQFRARVIVLHGNRILQTLILHTPGPGQELRLDLENMVTPHLATTQRESPVDLAFVLGGGSSAEAGATMISTDGPIPIEPAGLDASMQTFQNLLSTLNIGTAGDTVTFDDDVLLKMLIDLANHGSAVLRELEHRGLPIDRYNAARRIQVVDSVAGTYLPVEFLYSGAAPRHDAALCPSARTALESDDVGAHSDCPNAQNAAFVCPAAFWGFSKFIERQTSGTQREHIFSVPVDDAHEIAPFNSAMVAASKAVAPADLTGPSGVVQALQAVTSTVEVAQSWDDWRTRVTDATTPTLLVLLPHSANSPDIVNMPALEICDTWLESSRLDADYVHPAGRTGPGPLVMLLGCSTALTDIAFLNFAREFKRSGAPIVVGTLATIHGARASAFATQLLHMMKEVGAGRPFDEIMLLAKRKMLAAGDPFVLSLTAYGHGSWHLKT